MFGGSVTDPDLRIFSYLPNPRVWKALIVSELNDARVEVVGAKPAELAGWLWDYDARPLSEAERVESSPHARTSRRGFSGTLYKTDAFLHAHPFGTVPAAFASAGEVGVFESNSILRAAARAGRQDLGLYGDTPSDASRIDSFLDATLVFAREAQVYLLGMDDIDPALYSRMSAAYEFYASGLENALTANPFLAGSCLTIADIAFVCDFSQFLREGHYAEQLQQAGLQPIAADGLANYPRVFAHMLKLSEEPAFARHMGTYLNWFRRKHGMESSSAAR